MNSGFAHPWVLWFLVAIPAAWVILWAATSRRSGIASSVPSRLYAAGGSWRIRARWAPLVCTSAALALLIVGLARPREAISDSESSRDTIALQLVVDRSGSMEELARFQGEALTRLEAVKRVVENFVVGNGDDLRGREGDLLGLIVFGTYADTISPLTRSHGPLVEALRRVELPRIEHEKSTAIGDALVLASARLKATEDTLRHDAEDEAFELASKAIVLLTDGENREGQYSPAQAAQLAAQWGIKVYIVAIDTEGGRAQGFFQMRPSRDVKRERMDSIADMTGGRAWVVDSLDELSEVYAAIDELERTEIRITETTRYEEHFVPYIRASALLGVLAMLGRVVIQEGASV